jgi:nitrogen-specific signal transduction histidine kinase
LQARATDKALVIDVGDQGPGLPDERAKYLLGPADEGPAVGSGLGLWIVRRLVADEHGEIALVQESGLTTVIRIAWPFRNETPQPAIIADRLVEETIHAE